MAKEKCCLIKKVCKQHCGFTLIEVMISVAILAIVVTSLLMSMVYCLILNQTSSNLIVAAGDAQAVLEDIKGLPDVYNSLDNYVIPGFDNLDNEEISVTVNQISTGLKEIIVDVEWLEKQRENSFQLLTRIRR